jgi:uncharacterized protein (TIGR02147 family)
MKKTSIYEYKSYKQFILDWMAATPNEGRGQRKLIAEAIGCQNPFITHVLSGDYQFSPEQAEACGRYMGLNDADTEFFILLVLKQRSGTKTLENLFAKQISNRCEQHAVLKKRLNIQESMPLEDQMIYYSSWHYAAIHMALMIPELQNVSSLTRYFNLPTSRVMSVLQFLSEHHLIEQKSTHYKIKKSVLHLEKDSPILTQHHTHWRLRAIEAIQTPKLDNLHYSGIMSLSRDDYEWVRERLARLLEEVVVRLGPSKDEKLATLCFDLFQV